MFGEDDLVRELKMGVRVAFCRYAVPQVSAELGELLLVDSVETAASEVGKLAEAVLLASHQASRMTYSYRFASTRWQATVQMHRW